MAINSIVLADDESIQRDTLSTIIQRYVSADIRLCSNGRDALSLIEEELPDLLITDIRMPVMGGMELIKEVSSRYPSLKIVLISAYSEFSYAKTAITCGVSEYLLKPFRPEEIRKLLEKLDAEISAAQAQSLWDRLQKKAAANQQLMALSASLYGLPLPAGKETDLSALVPPRGRLLLFRWKSRQNHGVAKSPPPGNVLTDRQQEQLLFQLCQNFPEGIFLPLRKGLDSSECRLLVLLPESRSEEELLKSLSSFQQNFIYWTVVASYFIEEIASLKEIFQQANQLLSYSFYYPETSQTFSLDPEVLTTVPSMLSLHAYEKTLREAVHAGKLEAAERSLKELYSLLSRKPRRFPTDVRYRISSMTVNILRELDSMISSREYDDLLNRAYSLFSICDSFPELFQISYELLKSTSVYFVQETGTTDVVEDIIAYIKKHFTEDLTLPQLAENVHFSANYLSAQIKKKTGMSYINYVSLLRMEYAEQLLTGTNLKVSEVAAKCGYHDNSYFNRIFCRKYGTTPEQYRKAHKKCSEN